MSKIKKKKSELQKLEKQIQKIIKDELNEMRDKYGDERRSRIEYSASEMRMEDLIPDEEVIITISQY